jgi:ATP-dependent Clp protease ATP-binding subunit ClpA
MLERFTDQARRVVVLAEEEARMLDHNWIGTEHLLLGVLREGDGVGARALESLGISLQPVRQQVEEIIGPVQQVPAEYIPFTPRSKKVLELSLRESLQLGHDRVGTGHILLGLIREGDGVAAQVLVRLGADLNQVRQQVIELVSDLRPQSGRRPQPGRRPPREVVPVMWTHARLDVFGGRLAAVEQRVGIGPDTSDLDEQIAQVRREKESAVDARDYEQAAERRNREKELLASKAARQEQWAAGHPALPDLAEQVQRLTDEVERLRALLRQHGIDPQDKPA